MYQMDTVSCENVGCTLTSTCTGGFVDYPCDLQKTESDCSGYDPFCAWE
jgi:hypothetical protein